MALIVSALIGAPTFSADLCKGYTHSRDGEIQAVYNLVINNEIVECSSAEMIHIYTVARMEPCSGVMQ